MVNSEYIVQTTMSQNDIDKLKLLLKDYHKETGSSKAEYILSDWENIYEYFSKYVPHSMIDKELISEDESVN